jgi:hypothetical protein
MIKNIYKSYITTIIGVLFFATDITYIFVKLTPDNTIIMTLAAIGIILLFMSDKIAKRALNLIIDKKI